MSDDNVTPIENGKRKRAVAKPKDDAEKIPSFVERYKWLRKVIDRVPLPTEQQLPAMAHEYRAFSPNEGLTRLLLKIDPDTEIASISNRDALTDDVLNHLQTPAYTFLPLWEWDHDRALKFAKFYLSTCKMVPEPKAFRWQGESGLCYKRLPWEMRVGPTPFWDQFLVRFGNSQAFRDWIGSLFVEGAYMQDYCWIFGFGEDGKGVLNRFLHKVFGRAYLATEPPSKNDNFWNEALMGKRLVVFGDCNDTKFVTEGRFKSLTGGDPISVNPKWEKRFTYMPKAKYLFFSNERPEISSERADKRRLILCEIDPNAAKIESDDFEGELWREGGMFIAKCIEGYALRSQGHLPVMQSAEGYEAIDSLVSTLEEEMEELFSRAFYLSSALSLKPKDMDLVIRSAFPTRQRQKEFRNWMERTYGIKKVSKKQPDGTVTKEYLGIGLTFYKDRDSGKVREEAEKQEAITAWIDRLSERLVR